MKITSNFNDKTINFSMSVTVFLDHNHLKARYHETI